jgi:hypothetical protein
VAGAVTAAAAQSLHKLSCGILFIFKALPRLTYSSRFTTVLAFNNYRGVNPARLPATFYDR